MDRNSRAGRQQQLQMKGAIWALLARLGAIAGKKYQFYCQDGLLTLHSDSFRRDKAFRHAYERGVRAGAGVDPQFEWRVQTALWAARHCLNVPGDFIECGVNAGFVSSAIMQYCDWNTTGRRYFLIDTFAGPVFSKYSQEEIAKGRIEVAKEALGRGAYVTDLARVRANFAEWPAAEVIQGAVPEVLGEIDFGAAAFVHLDMNCAQPEAEALQFFYPRLSAGGMILFDDYTYRHHDAQREAVNAVAEKFGVAVLALPTGQGLIVK